MSLNDAFFPIFDNSREKGKIDNPHAMAITDALTAIYHILRLKINIMQQVDAIIHRNNTIYSVQWKKIGFYVGGLKLLHMTVLYCC